MNLPEKIAYLRKSQGWSQEEFAERLSVSRQSVSKWESGASTPELDRIVDICKLFGLTADALIRDDLPLEAPSRPAKIPDGRPVLTLEDAYAYIAQFQVVARRIAAGVAACVASPAPMLLLSAFAPDFLSEAIGLPVLLIMVGWAVWQFVVAGGIAQQYRHVEKGRFTAVPGVSEWVRSSRDGFRPAFTRDIALGVMLCVVSPAPIIFMDAFFDSSSLADNLGAAILLAIVAAGVYLFVLRGTLQNCYHRLLKEKV